MREPRQHYLFHLENRFGFSTLLAGRSREEGIVRIPDLAGLSVLPAGPTPPNPLELLNRLNFDEFMIQAKGAYDVVIVDTPAMASGEDAAMIAVRTKGRPGGRRGGSTRGGGLHRSRSGPHGSGRRDGGIGAERGSTEEIEEGAVSSVLPAALQESRSARSDRYWLGRPSRLRGDVPAGLLVGGERDLAERRAGARRPHPAGHVVALLGTARTDRRNLPAQHGARMGLALCSSSACSSTWWARRSASPSPIFQFSSQLLCRRRHPCSLLRGKDAIRVAWFALFYFVFMIPLPGILVDAVTGPLKQWISIIVVEILYPIRLPDQPQPASSSPIGQYQMLVADLVPGSLDIPASRHSAPLHVHHGDVAARCTT